MVHSVDQVVPTVDPYEGERRDVDYFAIAGPGENATGVTGSLSTERSVETQSLWGLPVIDEKSPGVPPANSHGALRFSGLGKEIKGIWGKYYSFKE